MIGSFDEGAASGSVIGSVDTCPCPGAVFAVIVIVIVIVIVTVIVIVIVIVMGRYLRAAFVKA